MMSKGIRTHLACLAGLAVLACLAFSAGPPTKPAPQAPPYRVSGPFTHDNLTIFLLHGPDQIKSKTILTLDEALAAKKVIVHETKDVNKLSIENIGEQEVFVQSGDIVKGGQQDRVLAMDMIVPGKSGKIPVASFCVEQGRWNKRGVEDDKKFDSSKDNLVSNRLKLAARYQGKQSEVWKNVQAEQTRLGQKLMADLKDGQSESSLQLTLENKKLLDNVVAYTKKLESCIDKKDDVVGYAVVINGKIHSADAYANAELFKKLWPKMLKSSAIEAIAEKDDKKKFELIRTEVVLAFLADPERGKSSEKGVTKDVTEYQKETDNNVLFETKKDDKVLRRNYLAK